MPPGGRPSITIGIQPQIALYTVILGSVCAFGWYTEKYRRDEDDIDGQIKRMYVSDMKQAHEKLPQMTATIRGQDVRLDDRMNKLVWGGKAHMEQVNSGAAFGGGFGGGGGSKSSRYEDEDNASSTMTPVRVNVARNVDEDDDSSSPSKKKKKRRKKRKGKKSTNADKVKEEEAPKAPGFTKFAIQTTIVGVSVGAVAVAAVTFLGGGSTSKR
ncbi:hypothetical protein IV203_007983 [Nitzschia inconspicua]|uniref:Uncharacterized protein n=1 Tax=Nitzschia inconspicua TaxID=303405 RepID=A0A9K3KXQ4_9STRA|nr:hypothetical protein IV203_007983 [Nitzschia inconspicua]